MTVFAGSKIKTDQGGVATLNLGKKIGTIKIQAESEMTLDFAQSSVGGDLPKGKVTLIAPKNVIVNVMTAAAKVVSFEGLDSIFTIEANAERTKICVEKGKADLKTNSLVTAGKASLKAPGTIEPVREGESLAVTTAGQTVRHRCAPAKPPGKEGNNSSGGSGGNPVIPIAIAGTGAAIAGIVAGATPPSGTLTGVTSNPGTGASGEVTPIRPTPQSPFCDCRFNRVSGRILNPRQPTSVCHKAANGTRVSIALTCGQMTDHFNANGTPRAGHEDDYCGVCGNN
jgi:hypothetical protein